MARRVFFSFKYEDVTRAMVVRNSWVTQGCEAAGFIDAASFEEIRRQGDDAIRSWINDQLRGTSVTVVLVGEKTCSSRWVKYEIQKSVERGNGLIGIDGGLEIKCPDDKIFFDHITILVLDTFWKSRIFRETPQKGVTKSQRDTGFIFGIPMTVTTIWVAGSSRLRRSNRL